MFQLWISTGTVLEVLSGDVLVPGGCGVPVGHIPLGKGKTAAFIPDTFKIK